MTKRQATYHKSLIQQIHTSKRYQNHYKDNRDEYEELLLEHFGKSSSKDLKIDQLVMLRDYFNFHRNNLPIQKKTRSDQATMKQLNTIRSIWSQYADDPSDEALLKFIKRQLKKQLLHVKNLTLEEAQKLIPLLLKMQDQKG